MNQFRAGSNQSIVQIPAEYHHALRQRHGMKSVRAIPVLLVLSIVLYRARSQDTFSICAVDTMTGEVGSAGASCLDSRQVSGGCVVISDVHPGKGVIHTQALLNTENKNYARTLMERGLAPAQIIDSLVANDAQGNPGVRQYGIVDLHDGGARTCAFTGSDCTGWKGHIEGPSYCIQGNILLGKKVLDSMEVRFLREPGDLACKLMAAMQGAKMPGADTRCEPSGNSSLSAFLRLARPGDTTDSFALDLIIPRGPYGYEPIDSLQVLFERSHDCAATAVDAGLRRQGKQLCILRTHSIMCGHAVSVALPGQAECILSLFNCTGALLVQKKLQSNAALIIGENEHGAGPIFYRVGIPKTGVKMQGKLAAF
jgi:uncharacterized Ntn-hydrolase superfamily protein